MSEREVQAAVDQIAAALGTGVSLDDLTGQLVAYSVHKGSVDQARVRTLLNRYRPGLRN